MFGFRISWNMLMYVGARSGRGVGGWAVAGEGEVGKVWNEANRRLEWA
jgi:hypothetical protein